MLISRLILAWHQNDSGIRIPTYWLEEDPRLLLSSRLVRLRQMSFFGSGRHRIVLFRTSGWNRQVLKLRLAEISYFSLQRVQQ